MFFVLHEDKGLPRRGRIGEKRTESNDLPRRRGEEEKRIDLGWYVEVRKMEERRTRGGGRREGRSRGGRKE
jgi:hypothetical protein